MKHCLISQALPTARSNLILEENMFELENISDQNDIRLHRLLQLYQYDWSEITRQSVIDDQGLFQHVDLNKFWHYPNSKAYLIKVAGEIAGFVMLKKHSYIPGESPAMGIDEFFVMRKFRNQNIGTEVAIEIFNKFPGSWQVAEMFENTMAQKFWRKTIAIYTMGNYKEIIADNEYWQGPVQLFKSTNA